VVEVTDVVPAVLVWVMLVLIALVVVMLVSDTVIVNVAVLV